MKSLYFILGLLFLLSRCQTENSEESLVVPLGEKNFTEFINSNEYVHVLFYAPWCSYCKSLAPEYEKAAKSLKGEAVLAKVDATEENSLADTYEIQGFPTVKFFKNGKYYTDFDGDRTSNDIINWTRKRMGPPSILISTKEELENFLKKEAASHIIYFHSKEGSESLKAFEATADHPELSPFEFAHIVNDDLKQTLNQDNSVVVFVRGEVQAVLKDSFDETSLLTWIDKNGFPQLETLKLNQEFIERTARRGNPLVIVFRNETSSFSLDDQFNFAKKISETPFDFNIHFFETKADAYPDLAVQWGASGEKYPTFILVTFPENSEPVLKAFDEDIEVNEENVVNWIKSCVSGTECSFNVRSQKLTDEELNDSVFSIVGKTFNKIVYDDTKDVFVKFYSPDCPHCILMSKEWRKLSNAYANVDSVVIAWINGIENTIPEDIPLTGFPTIMLFKSGDKKNPITYSGPRKQEDFSDFLKKNAGIKFDESLVKLVEEESNPSTNDINVQVDDTSENVDNTADVQILVDDTSEDLKVQVDDTKEDVKDEL